MKSIGNPKNPDIGVDGNGNIVLRNEQNGKTVSTRNTSKLI